MKNKMATSRILKNPAVPKDYCNNPSCIDNFVQNAGHSGDSRKLCFLRVAKQRWGL